MKKTLLSIVGQTFTDFEAIVTNDYPEDTLSAEVLEIDDPRIRFVNNPRNLGELANMNALLSFARGKYFTWQFDDDLYDPNFLRAAHDAIIGFNFPLCVYTSYKLIREDHVTDHTDSRVWQKRLLSGRQFLRLYLSGEVTAMGCTGVYDTEYIRGIGGVERLTDGPFALFSEYLLLLRAGLLERVAYVDAPLAYYFAHRGSWGTTNREVDAYKQAGENIVRKSVGILSSPSLREDFSQNLSSVLRLVFHEYVARCSMQPAVSSFQDAMTFLASLKTSLDQSNEHDLGKVDFPSLWRVIRWFLSPFLVAKFKVAAPRPLVKLAYKAHWVLRRDRFFRFK